ncbi:cobalt-precorrin-6A reductase [Tsukamurella sp. 8F]|uniref:cobalt-precorrin-6A reductase n=1 Tax=unclassified Tsukamurella TaxID=2633480 RepID=UPI0023B93713|nr:MULTISPECIES: cobalt-precorrin-6A reductase [unclassified Tsukamurella]MDF0530564.1 cobalt-precorrin-6A reductase [Tsukamurella sp. 8J]MDF0586786.1 cobalt-precorrin-6A reductase [Tsukamurella sp. 8F]
MTRPESIKVLVLGGTAEGRELAGLLDAEPGYEVESSLAGRVTNPRLPPGRSRIGGFGGADGLADYVRSEGIRALVDATHPFAATISRNVAEAAGACDVPVVAVVRPPWQPDPADTWERVPSVAAAAAELDARTAGRALLTTGRQDVHEFAHLNAWWFVIRVVDPPSKGMPRRHALLLDRGPYTLDGETDLLSRNRIDVLVTKNSGGDLVSAKLTAARELGVDVVMVDRPPRPDGVRSVATAAEAFTWLRALG